MNECDVGSLGKECSLKISPDVENKKADSLLQVSGCMLDGLSKGPSDPILKLMLLTSGERTMNSCVFPCFGRGVDMYFRVLHDPGLDNMVTLSTCSCAAPT